MSTSRLSKEQREILGKQRLGLNCSFLTDMFFEKFQESEIKDYSLAKVRFGRCIVREGFISFDDQHMSRKEFDEHHFLELTKIADQSKIYFDPTFLAFGKTKDFGVIPMDIVHEKGAEKLYTR